ncbi:hypothetical protein DM02DRAFT_612585 [Periconia macrospinosa]|uniref:Uncharacterized protein n=1 Tax=Periconia macrospinosa TaxID=97972 RepID=A0A2V1E0D9_9PLEO|nr:hypothetical protein DM02DRAFT_612585 [Periconia macrospinosa]
MPRPSRKKARTPDVPLATRVTRSTQRAQQQAPRAQQQEPRAKRNKAAEDEKSKAKKERKKRRAKAKNKKKLEAATDTSNAPAEPDTSNTRIYPDTFNLDPNMVIDPDNIGDHRPPRVGERPRLPVLHPYHLGAKGRYGIDIDLDGNPIKKTA